VHVGDNSLTLTGNNRRLMIKDTHSRSYGCAGYPGTGEPYTGTPSEAEEPPVCLWTRVRVDPSRLDGRAQPLRVPRRSWRPGAVAGMRDACHCMGTTTLGTRYKTTTIETVTRTRSRVSTLDRLTRRSASATGLRRRRRLRRDANHAMIRSLSPARPSGGGVRLGGVRDC
jgi:hypothetical protein